MPKPTLYAYTRIYTTMDIGHCLTVRIQDESCEVPQAADKTLTQRLLCLSPARKPVNGPRLVDAAKIQKIHYYKHVYFIQ